MHGTAVPIFLHLLKQKRHKWLEMSFEIASKSAGGGPIDVWCRLVVESYYSLLVYVK